MHSRIRELAFGPEDRCEKYLGYMTASFATVGYPHRDEHAYVSYATPGRQISRYALRDGRSAFFFVWTPKAKVVANDLDAQKRAIMDAFASDTWTECGEIFARLAASDDVYFDSVSQIQMPAWSRGRIVLLGDAAFCPSLLAGEGSSFAMAGAYLLAGELAAAHGDHRVAFAAYESLFRSFIERKQKAARRFASSFAPSTRFGLFARDQLLRWMNAPVLGTWLLRRMVADDFSLPAYAGRETN